MTNHAAIEAERAAFRRRYAAGLDTSALSALWTETLERQVLDSLRILIEREEAAARASNTSAHIVGTPRRLYLLRAAMVAMGQVTGR